MWKPTDLVTQIPRLVTRASDAIAYQEQKERRHEVWELQTRKTAFACGEEAYRKTHRRLVQQ